MERLPRQAQGGGHNHSTLKPKLGLLGLLRPVLRVLGCPASAPAQQPAPYFPQYPAARGALAPAGRSDAIIVIDNVNYGEKAHI